MNYFGGAMSSGNFLSQQNGAGAQIFLGRYCFSAGGKEEAPIIGYISCT